MTTLYIRHPAKVSVDAADEGHAPVCQYALAGDGGDLQQQGAAALGSLGDLIASARRVVMLMSAADVTLLRVKVPPLSPARLRAALPNMIEEQILGDPADCALTAGPSDAEGIRPVAVVQRSWLAVLVQAALAQGARSVSVLPAQLCLPLVPGTVSASIIPDHAGQELTIRVAAYEGVGLTMAVPPFAALETVRAFAGQMPVSLYMQGAQSPTYQALLEGLDGVTMEQDHWGHWIAGARSAGMDLAPSLGGSTSQARNWHHWRWPLRLAALVVLVNVAGLNLEWMGLKRDAERLRSGILQTFKAAYPNESVILDAPAQMRKNIAAAQLESGQIAPDEFTAISAAFGEALAAVQGKGAVASLEYRERALTVKIKPDRLDGNAVAQIKSALAARHLILNENAPDTWQIKAGAGPAAAPMAGKKS